MMRRPPRSTLFPYTTLFRSINAVGAALLLVAARELWNHGGRLASYNDVTIYLRVPTGPRSEEHMSELQSRQYLVCRLLLDKQQNLHVLTLRIHLFSQARPEH